MTRLIDDSDAIIAEDTLIADVQFAIHNLMEAKGMSRADLARALKVSDARISQIFHDNPKNLTLRTLARIFHVLGEEPQLTSATLKDIIPVEGSKPASDKRRGRGSEHSTLMLVCLRADEHAHSVFQAEANDNVDEAEFVAAVA
jgi:transcriptional regulator with XRE-family HTH domain